jgi:glycogen debranching enzyme GlgX/4-alpha-glucanotransferase
MLAKPKFEIVEGVPEPLGATLMEGGANFALYSHHAESVVLCLFDETGQTEIQRLALPGRTGDHWHGFVPAAPQGMLYGYRVHGKYAPRDGHRFNPNKLLIDPYARSLSAAHTLTRHQFGFKQETNDDLTFDERDSAPYMPKCRLVAPGPPVETGTQHRRSWRDTVIYELHPKGFTQLDRSVPEQQRGKYAALGAGSTLRRLRNLGVTAVELLPIFAFNDEPHLIEKSLTNYWGYNPFCFLAPDPRYAQSDARLELAQAVRRLHDAGIEVILDVVFNHSGEGYHLGPTLSFKGIDNASYYCLEPGDASRYVDIAGCGNTLDFSRPHVQRLLIDSLRSWITDFGIDGFRFDLATTIARTNSDHSFSPHSNIFSLMAADPLISRAKLIAEPWDIGPGGYQLGKFPAGWAEWNDRSRDAIRRFWRGDNDMAAELARRVSGSIDEMGNERGPLASVNFVAAHDGMRLRDLVTYSNKKNHANGEDNRDGGNHDFGSAYGADGESKDDHQRVTRLRQMRNMLATVFLAQGVPMFAAGDEIGQSQSGNNNAYCQDNEISWIDWDEVGDDGLKLAEFVRRMIAIRMRYPALRSENPLSGNVLPGADIKDASWHRPDGREMCDSDWEQPWVRCLGLLFAARSEGPAEHLLVLFNAHDGTVDFQLPKFAGIAEWSMILDTAADIDAESRLTESPMQLAPRSLIVLSHPCTEKKQRRASTSDATLERLSELAGISPSFRDNDGVEHVVSPDTQRTLLRVMGLEAGTQSESEETLRRLENSPWEAMLPPCVVIRLASEQPFLEQAEVPLTIHETMGSRILHWSLLEESGRRSTGETHVKDLEVREFRQIDGNNRLRLLLKIEKQLPLGRHTLEVTLANIIGTCELIVAPQRCFQPDWMLKGDKVWGVAHQLYALRRETDCGVGNFTCLNELVENVSGSGGAFVGVNPLHALSISDPDCSSPYAPSSRLFLNWGYIDVLSVPEFEGSIAGLTCDIEGEQWFGHRLVNSRTVSEQKLRALEQLFATFLANAGSPTHSRRHLQFERFVRDKGAALRNFALHQSLGLQFGRENKQAWAQFSSPMTQHAQQFARDNAGSIRFHSWVQFEADRQLRLAKGNMKLGLYGDIAAGVDPMGADVWSEPSAFNSHVSFGAPPDQLARDGQNWGLLPFDAKQLRESAYRPVSGMLKSAMQYCGAVRIDHVMWLDRMYWIPEGAKTSDGAYVRYPLNELLGVIALESHRHKSVVVGEDLGTVPEGFRERMHHENMLSYKLMCFERHESGLYRRPSCFPGSCLATPASHDLPTIAGHLMGRDLEVRQSLGLSSATETAHERTVRELDITLLISALVDQALLPADFLMAGSLSPQIVQGDEKAFPEQSTMNGAVGPAGNTPQSMDKLYQVIEAIYCFLARTPSVLMSVNIEDIAGSLEQVNLPGELVGYPCWKVRLNSDVRETLNSPFAQSLFKKIDTERRAAVSN